MQPCAALRSFQWSLVQPCDFSELLVTSVGRSLQANATLMSSALSAQKMPPKRSPLFIRHVRIRRGWVPRVYVNGQWYKLRKSQGPEVCRYRLCFKLINCHTGQCVPQEYGGFWMTAGSSTNRLVQVELRP